MVCRGLSAGPGVHGCGCGLGSNVPFLRFGLPGSPGCLSLQTTGWHGWQNMEMERKHPEELGLYG